MWRIPSLPADVVLNNMEAIMQCTQAGRRRGWLVHMQYSLLDCWLLGGLCAPWRHEHPTGVNGGLAGPGAGDAGSEIGVDVRRAFSLCVLQLSSDVPPSCPQPDCCPSRRSLPPLFSPLSPAFHAYA
jgi:hypothetical protein